MSVKVKLHEAKNLRDEARAPRFCHTELRSATAVGENFDTRLLFYLEGLRSGLRDYVPRGESISQKTHRDRKR